MRLNKLYTNRKDFKNIQFKAGVNVIYADVKSNLEDNKNSHNLGKTLLIELIDFLLLKTIAKKADSFFYTAKKDNGKAIFSEYIFYLELLLNDKKYLTIKREIKSNTKISFSLSETSTPYDFEPPSIWNSVDCPIDKAKLQLAEYLNFDFFKDKPYDYRKAINYCLRRQGDYQDIYRLTKFKGKDADWKPFMFDLLGFNGRLLEEKYTAEAEIDLAKSFIKEEEKNFTVKSKEKDEIIGQIQVKETEKNKLENIVNNFNFYDQDKAKIEALVENIEERISDLNTVSYNLEFEINKIKLSIKNKFSFDLKLVEQVFEESKIYFPNQLKKDYQQVLEFNQKLTTERNKLLVNVLSKKEKELSDTSIQLRDLHSQKTEFASYFRETSIFKKFKTHQKDIVQIEGELFRLKEKLKIVDIIAKKEEEIDKIKDNIKLVIEKIRFEYNHTSENVVYTEIRNHFSKYYKSILDELAVLSWTINFSDNVDFSTPKVQGKGASKQFTQQDKGYTYYNLFCVCFDLAVLVAYNNQPFYKFVYHDDVVANKDRGVKLRFLELLKDLTDEVELQYIFTIIKEDVPVDNEGNVIGLAIDDIILELHDKDENGTLFGFRF